MGRPLVIYLLLIAAALLLLGDASFDNVIQAANPCQLTDLFCDVR